MPAPQTRSETPPAIRVVVEPPVGRYAIVGLSVAASLTAILAGVTASRRRRERDQAREQLLREQEEELQTRRRFPSLA